MKAIMGRIHDMKIHNKLTLSYIVASIVPLLVAGLVIYKASAESLEETTLELASIFNAQIVTNIDNFIEEYDRITKSFLYENDVLRTINSGKEETISELVQKQLYMRGAMTRLFTLKPDIKGICLLTVNGRLYYFSNSGSSIDKEELKKQDWLKKIADSEEGLVITSVHDCSYYEKGKDGLTISVGRRILDYNGLYAGVLVIDLEPSGLIQLNDEFLLTRRQYNIKFSITDLEGSILYDSDIASGRMTWEEAEEETLLYDKAENDFIIMSSRTGMGDLIVNMVIPRSKLLFSIKKINYVAIISIAVCAAFAVIMSYLLGRAITRPIYKLQKRMGQMEEGEYKVIPYEQSKDEIGALISSYNKMVTKIKNLIEQVYVAEIRQKNAEYLALQTQINPHMLYNTLESIRMKALVNGEEEIADMIKILARMFRMALNAGTGEHTVRDEIAYAENYVRLQNIRFPDRFEIKVQMEEGLAELPVIALVFQPVIENSIEHGSSGSHKTLHITVEGKRTKEGDIRIWIEDDGRGISEKTAEALNRRLSGESLDEAGEAGAESSIGLSNIAERLRLYYGKQYYLKIWPVSSGGTAVEILFPVRCGTGKKTEGNMNV